jgi:hypothetical protein
MASTLRVSCLSSSSTKLSPFPTMRSDPLPDASDRPRPRPRGTKLSSRPRRFDAAGTSKASLEACAACARPVETPLRPHQPAMLES